MRVLLKLKGFLDGNTVKGQQNAILSWRGSLVLGLSLFVLARPSPGQTVIANVPVGPQPAAVAVNTVTNKIYVANVGSPVISPYVGDITVIDGATNATTTIADSYPSAMAVNSVTNKIYVTNYSSNNVTVIDGATNSTTTVADPNAVEPASIALNPVTNKIYVANIGAGTSGNVTVIDGASSSTTTITDPSILRPASIAVNPVTNKIYVASYGSITVIDGATNATISIALGYGSGGPGPLAINLVTNKIYMAGGCSIGCPVLVIDGVTDSITTVTDPNAKQPEAIAVNPVTNKIYVVNGISNNITVIDGTNNSTTTITDPKAVGPMAVAVNSVTNKIYVNNGNFTVTVIDGATGSIVTLPTPENSWSECVNCSNIAVNTATDRTYVADSGNSVSIIAGVTPAGPFSSVQPVSGNESSSFLVQWSGTDNSSTITDYTIYVSDNEGVSENFGPFTPWLTHTTATEARFVGTVDHSYGFYSIATDTSGKVENPKSVPEALAYICACGPAVGNPVSHVSSLPIAEFSAFFVVQWSGTDSGGPGIANYTVYVSDNGGPFTAWLTATTATGATFTGASGHRYGFYSIASDAAGNVESPKSVADAITYVDATKPVSHVSALPATASSPNFLVLWSGTDAGGPGIRNYDIYASDNGGGFNLWQANSTAAQAWFPGYLGHTYRFFSQATDIDGNQEGLKSTADATTQVPAVMAADVNGDGQINCLDVALVKAVFGTKTGQPGYNPAADVNKDGVVDVRDLAAVTQKLASGTTCP